MRKTYLLASLVYLSISTCALAALTISGTITEASNRDKGMPDVTVFGDNGGGSATTDSSGYYSIDVPQGWSGRVTPTKAGYEFQPTFRDYSSVTDNQIRQDYFGSLPTVATPTFSPTGGAYADSVTVAISCATDGAVIYYTTDGSGPTENSAVYTEAINITSTITLKAKAFKPGWLPSITNSSFYDIVVSTPLFTPAGGGYSDPVMVSITCDTPGAVIRCTLDSTEPTDSSDIYSDPILLGDVVIKAKAWKTGKTPSKTKTALYVIGPGLADDPNELDDGDFEEGDSSLTLYSFTPPLCWKRITYPASINQVDCFASLYSSFTFGGGIATWETPESFEGNSFAVLSTGGFDDVENSEIQGSMLSQRINLSAGDTIVGAFFFGTTDYLPFNDYAQISLELAVDPNLYPNSVTSFVIPDTYRDIVAVGNFQSTNSWVPFSHTVEPSQVGEYFIRCEVVDDQDPIYNSYLAVDGFRICRGGKPDGDLNYDCEVTLIDFAYLANYWGLTGCNSGTDCGRADIDGSGDVALPDLLELAYDWLQ